MANIVLNGFIQAGGDGCGCDGAGSGVTERLGLLCGTGTYQSIIDTPTPIRILTDGSVGDTFVDLDLLSSFEQIEFLYVKSNAPIELRIGAQPASKTSTSLAASIVFVGGEIFDVTIDGTLVATTFLTGSLTLQGIANRINGAAAALGLATPRVTVVGTTLVITGIETRYDATTGEGAVTIGTNTATAMLGFTASSAGYAAGEDVSISGTAIFEFPRYPNAPARIQASGQASLTILAAGRTSP